MMRLGQSTFLILVCCIALGERITLAASCFHAHTSANSRDLPPAPDDPFTPAPVEKDEAESSNSKSLEKDLCFVAVLPDLSPVSRSGPSENALHDLPSSQRRLSVLQRLHL